MFMVFCVLDDPNLLDQVLEAWHAVGIRGATIAETTGFRRKRDRYVPMRFIHGTDQLLEGNCTIFAIVGSEEMIHNALEAAEGIVGDFNLPNTGVFASWPITSAKGVPMNTSTSGETG